MRRRATSSARYVSSSDTAPQELLKLASCTGEAFYERAFEKGYFEPAAA
jgi:hypothetical protein